jgi:ABC-2 type transport system permease protein
LFPIALLPDWTTPLSYLLSPYWAARALHGAARGEAGAAEMALCWGMMLLFSALYVGLARWLFQMVMRKARVDATLNMY